MTMFIDHIGYTLELILKVVPFVILTSHNINGASADLQVKFGILLIEGSRTRVA